MKSKPLLALVFSLLVIATGCGPSSSSLQREAEISELKISNSNLIAQLQQSKLQADNDKLKRESEVAELKAGIVGLSEQLQQTKKQAEEERAKQEIERLNSLRQQAAQQADSKKRDTAQKVFKELLKLRSITESGVSYSQYSERLLDIKTTIEMALIDVGDQKFSSDVSEILLAYVDARDFWLSCIQYPRIQLIDSEKLTLQKYNIKQLSEYWKYDIYVSGIWSVATDHINKLANNFPDFLK